MQCRTQRGVPQMFPYLQYCSGTGEGDCSDKVVAAVIKELKQRRRRRQQERHFKI